MPNDQHAPEFGGLPVVEFTGWDALLSDFQTAMYWARNRREVDPKRPASYDRLFEALAAPESVAWRLRTRSGGPPEPRAYVPGKPTQDLDAYLDRFTDVVPPEAVRALVVGHLCTYDEPYGTEMDFEAVRDKLIELAPRLTNVRSLFYADVIQEEIEISWIEQTDLAPLVAAFPELAEFTVRGGGCGGLGLRVDGHTALRSLTVQSSVLHPEVVRDVSASSLPALEHLELWLGGDFYSKDGKVTVTADDLAPVLSGEAFPGLRRLGLRNTERTGYWVRALAEAPVTPTLEALDLSLGTLRDEDADVLLDAPAFRDLERLDLHHHFLSEDMAERVRAEFAAAGVDVDLSEPKDPHEHHPEEPAYYTAVSE
jgi:hypothetical protein